MYAGLVREDESEDEPDMMNLEAMKTTFREKLVIFCENDDELIEFFMGLEQKKEFIKQVERRNQEIRDAHLTHQMMQEF